MIKEPRLSDRALLLTVLLVTIRITQRWSQTGQKHAGAPDIAKHFLPTHRMILWELVVAVFLLLANDMIRIRLPGGPHPIETILSISLCLIAFGFKVTFTRADSPELLLPFQRLHLELLESVSLIYQARAVFSGLGLGAFYIVLRRTHHGVRGYVGKSR